MARYSTFLTLAAGLPGRRVLAAGMAIGLLAASNPAMADHRGWHGHRHDWHHHWVPGRYYPPPPVVYGGGYYPPPPVVYGPRFGLNIHIP